MSQRTQVHHRQPEDATTNAPVLHPWFNRQSACKATVRRRDVLEALQRRVVKALRLHELLMQISCV